MSETSVAASGNRVVVAVMNAPGTIETFTSRDAGVTWSAPVPMPMSIDGITYGYAADPTVAVLDDGSFGLAYLVVGVTPSTRQPFGNMGLAFVRSEDGVAWSKPVMLVAGAATFTPLADKPWLSVDRARKITYLVWSSSPADHLQLRVVYARSVNLGAKWSDPLPVTPEDAGETMAQLGALADGTLVVTTYDAAHGAFNSRTSTDNGASFRDPIVLGPDVGGTFITSVTKTYSAPMQTLAVFRNDLYCVYPAFGHVFFTRSRDDGLSWSQPLRLGGATDQAVMPSIAVNDASGAIVVAWLDGADGAMRLYATQSSDGGTTFETPRPFTPSFAAAGRLGDFNGTAIAGDGTAVTAFSTEGGYLNVARLGFTSASHRRAAGH